MRQTTKEMAQKTINQPVSQPTTYLCIHCMVLRFVFISSLVSSVFGICRHIHTVAHTHTTVWPLHIQRVNCLFTFQRAQDRVIRYISYTEISMKFFSIHLYFSTHCSRRGSFLLLVRMHCMTFALFNRD